VKRREFITLLGGAAAVLPLAAHAQQFGKMPRAGVLVSLFAPHPFTEAFRLGLREPGLYGRDQYCDRMAVRGHTVQPRAQAGGGATAMHQGSSSAFSHTKTQSGHRL
jgi:hypothetical protein